MTEAKIDEVRTFCEQIVLEQKRHRQTLQEIQTVLERMEAELSRSGPSPPEVPQGVPKERTRAFQHKTAGQEWDDAYPPVDPGNAGPLVRAGAPRAAQGGADAAGPSARVSLGEVARVLQEAFRDGKVAGELRSLPGIRKWAEDRLPGIQIEVIEERNDLWRLICLLDDQGHGAVLPTLGLNMGTVNLREWFEFQDYNGIDPIRPGFVDRPALAEKRDGALRLKEKGLIRAT